MSILASNLTSEPFFKMIVLKTGERIDEIGRLRYKVWSEKDPKLEKTYPNHEIIEKIDLSDAAYNWAIENLNGKIMASARLSFHQNIEMLPDMSDYSERFIKSLHFPLASLNRSVVDSDFRGFGFSKILDRVRLEKAIEIGCQEIVAAPKIYRVKAFQELGFIEYGVRRSGVLAPEIPIVEMKKILFRLASENL